MKGQRGLEVYLYSFFNLGTKCKWEIEAILWQVCPRERYGTHSKDRGGTVVKVLRYKSEGRWFYPRWCHWNFSLT